MTPGLSSERLAEIANQRERWERNGSLSAAGQLIRVDVPLLLAEVERGREVVEAARQLKETGAWNCAGPPTDAILAAERGLEAALARLAARDQEAADEGGVA